MSLSQPAHADRTNLDRPAARIALLGCGTVGSGVAHLLLESSAAIAARSGISFSLEAIAVRTLAKKRDAAVPVDLLCADAGRLVDDPLIDVVIECIGGLADAPALVERALTNGKHVVTANKDLLATRGPELRALAGSRHVSLAYEAAVGGAIPIVRTISKSLAGEQILEVGGVVNGTTNFILSAMVDGANYDDALREAQRRGFAEADPTGDVDGIDAAHKLAILAQLAFRRGLVTSAIPRAGITQIVRADLALAKRLGMTMKLIACARRTGSVVTPAYVRLEHPFAQGTGAQNCIRVVGRSSGSLTFAGTGAGREPTASAMIGDVVEVLHRIAAGVVLGRAVDDAPATGGRIDREPAIPLRHIVRLHSFRDARPAHAALARAEIATTLFSEVPALVTQEPNAGFAGALDALSSAGIEPESIIPLWEDIPHPHPPGGGSLS